MPPDRVRETAAALLKKARADEAALRRLATGGPEFDDAVGFHGQQAIEKAIKAVMAYAGVRVIKTHDIIRLREACEAAGIKVPGTETSGGTLITYAVNARYFEHQEGERPPLDRNTLIKDVETVLAWAEREITA